MGLGKTLLKTSPVGFAAVKGAEGRKDPEDVQVRHGGAVAEEQAIQDQELFSEQAVAKVSEPEVQLTASPVAALVDPNEKETLVGAKQSTSDELHAKGQNGQRTRFRVGNRDEFVAP